MKTILPLALFVALALAPAVNAACDWTVQVTYIEDLDPGTFSTVDSNAYDPWRDGVDVGHTSHTCGQFHWTFADGWGTMTAAPAWWSNGVDYVKVETKVWDENGTLLYDDYDVEYCSFPPNCGTDGDNNQLQVINGTHNYTVNASFHFIDSGTPANSFYDAQMTVNLTSTLNGETPTATVTTPAAAANVNEIVDIDITTSDANYDVDLVYAYVSRRNNTRDPSQGCGPEACVFFTPSETSTNFWEDTIDLENDGNTAWNAQGLPNDGGEYMVCAQAQNIIDVWSPVSCNNITFQATGGGGGGTGQLYGYLYYNDTANNETGRLNGATVTILDNGRVTTTDALGWFLFQNLAPDNYTVRFSKTRYVTYETTQAWDYSDNNTFMGAVYIEKETVGYFEPKTDEEIENMLRTYIPILFVITCLAFVYVILTNF